MGGKFPLIYGMIIATIRNKIDMTHESYIKQPMQLIEMKLNMIFSKNSHLMKALGRNINHPSIRKFCNIPFTIQ